MDTYNRIEKMIIDVPQPYADINYYRRPPKWRMLRHRHPFFQFIYVTNGSLVVQTYKEYILMPGDLCIIPPSIAHALYTPKGYDQLGFNLQEEGDDRNIIPLLTQKFNDFTVLTQLNLLVQSHTLDNIFTDISYLQKLRITNACDDILISCLELTETSDDSSFKLRLLNYLNSHIDTKVYLDDIAKFMTVSQTQLERLTHRHFGCSTIALFHKLKLQKACTLLIQKEDSIKKISTDLGFEDPAYFCRFFKNKIGTTPSEYREKHLFL